MPDDVVRQHLRAALDAVKAEENARVTAIYQKSDERHANEVLALRPVLDLLTELREVVGTDEGVKIDIAPLGHMGTVTTRSSTGEESLRFDYDLNRLAIRIEQRTSYFFAGGGGRTEIIFATTADEAVAHAVRVIGAHLGAKEALVAQIAKTHPKSVEVPSA